MGLLKPCSSYSSVWANLAARRENSISSRSMLSRRRMSSSRISAPVWSARAPSPLSILTLYEHLFARVQLTSKIFSKGNQLPTRRLRADLPAERGGKFSQAPLPTTGPNPNSFFPVPFLARKNELPTRRLRADLPAERGGKFSQATLPTPGPTPHSLFPVPFLARKKRSPSRPLRADLPAERGGKFSQATFADYRPNPNSFFPGPFLGRKNEVPTWRLRADLLAERGGDYSNSCPPPGPTQLLLPSPSPLSLARGLRGFGDGTQQRGVDLRAPVEGQQAVLLLFDVGQLRVAETLHRSGLHERLHHLSVRLEQLLSAGCLRVAEGSALKRDAAELADDDRLAAVAVARQVRRLLAVARLERRVEVRVAPPQGVRRRVVVQRAQVARRVLPAVV